MDPPSAESSKRRRAPPAAIASAAAVLIVSALGFLLSRGNPEFNGTNVAPSPRSETTPVEILGGSLQTRPDGQKLFVDDAGGRIEIPLIDGLDLDLRNIAGLERLVYVARARNPYGLPVGVVSGYFNSEVFILDARSGSAKPSRIGAIGLSAPIYETLRSRDTFSWGLNVDPTTGISAPYEMTIYQTTEAFHARVAVGSSVVSPTSLNVHGEDLMVRILPQTERATTLDFVDVRQQNKKVFHLLVSVALGADRASNDRGIGAGDQEITSDAGATILRVDEEMFDAEFIEQLGAGRFQSRNVNVTVMLASYETRPTTVIYPDSTFFGFDRKPGPIVHILANDSPLLRNA